MDKYEEAKRQLLAEHVRHEGHAELSKAEKYVLWFIDQEKKLAQERKNN
jgi:hypothetical protein